MAQKKQTAKRAAKPQSKARTTASRAKTKPKPDLDRRWSILMFGIGLLLCALAFIPGKAAWAWMRTGLFGLFGICTFVAGPLTVYLAVLVAKGRPLWGRLLRALLLMTFVCGTVLVFSRFEQQATFVKDLAALYETGKSTLGGGLLSLLFGYTLLALCGRPAANILLVILVVVGTMLFTGVTPLDIYSVCAVWLGRMREGADESYTEFSEQRAVRRAERQARLEAEQQELAARRAARKAARRQWDVPIDGEAFERAQQEHAAQTSAINVNLGPDPVQQEKLTDAPGDIVIGPGGTFGMYPGKQAKRNPFDVDIDDEPQQPGTGYAEPEEIEPLNWQPRSEAPVVFAAESISVPRQPEQAGELQPAPARVGADGVDKLIEKAVNATEQDAVLPLEESDEERLLLQSAPQAVAYRCPPITLFKEVQEPDEQGVQEEMKEKADTLVNTLQSFGVKTKILDISRGPAVTRYELQPQTGVKISRITGLSDDIALNLATTGVRIEAPIPGKPAVGVEIPNQNRATVGLRSVLESDAFGKSSAPLTFALGKDITGNCQVGNLAKMPHLLIAGTTGSGKSVCTNSIILSFLYRCGPEALRMILIDPKMVEFAHYNGIPHLLMPVVTEPRKAAGALGAAVAEMEKRYHTLAENGVPNIEEYNALAEADPSLEKMPYIVVVIDELADLMMVAGKEVEDYICRLAQKARAAGMHLIIATQRPSVDVITGLIKANIPSRIALSVMSQVDSRTILDTAGAEKLLGYGDMLYMPVGVNKPVRVQGTYVSSSEIKAVIGFIKENSTTNYDDDMISEMDKRAVPEKNAEEDTETGDEMDPMLKNAVEAVIDAGQASTSLLQRRCKLGYARAARIMDEMEQLHIIGPYQGAKPRQVLINRQQWIEMTMNNDPVLEEI